MKKLSILTAAIFCVACSPVLSQSLSINTDGSTADASAMLDVKSTIKGLLIPRMTTAQRTAITIPATGLQVYDTDLNLLYFYNGSSWVALNASTNYWTLSGGNIYNNTGTNVGIGSIAPLAKLTVEGTDYAGPQDLFKLSKNNYGSTIFSQYYTDAGNWGTAVRGSSGPVNAFTFNMLSGRLGIGTAAPGERLEINGNLRFSGIDTIYAAPSTTGSGKTLMIKAGDPYVPVGGSGGSINIVATNNMPSGGTGYGNLGPSGNINMTAGSGYNTAGGNINITAGQSSYWALVTDSHSDIILNGGFNINSTDAASLTTEGGHIISFNSSSSNGGNVIMKAGLGVGSGAVGNIQLLNGNVGIGTSAPSSKLEVCGDTRIIGTLNVSSTISSSSGITCPSDFRYKKNITPLKNSMQLLMMLQGVNYY